MSKIRILPEKVASQIAAGEVIERPFSVVRELMDNSIDAGASMISVKIRKGGRKSIRVSDNGHGMDRDDLLLCVERHATSKIREITDIFSVRTLGFRGEALPSIAAVSKMEIISRAQGALSGHKLSISGGKLGLIEEVGAPQGTTVEVRDLFFNVPARKKFLRTVKTETDRIIDVFTRLSLSFSDIHLRLQTDDRLQLNLPPTSDLVQRLALLLGKDVARSMICVQDEKIGVNLEAYLAPPEYGRSRGDRIYVYVNERNIRDRLVNKAIMEGYGQRLMKGIFPQAVIFIRLDPGTVDVNVHPTKQEVRFRNSQDVYRAIVMIINHALDRRRPSFVNRPLEGKRDLEIYEPALDYGESAGTQQIFRPSIPQVEEKIQESLFSEPIDIIGQLGKTYILCQVNDGLMIIDQHAAHERILYEKLKRNFHSSHQDVQTLLIPKQIELSMKERRILEEKGHLLKKLGIELEPFGGNTFLLRAVPTILLEVDWDRLLPQLVASLEEDGTGDHEEIDSIITLMACHGAVRAGHVLTQEEMRQLLAQLEELSLPTNCPHGRPILVHFSFENLEKMFKRIV